jgi:replication factor C small subunit
VCRFILSCNYSNRLIEPIQSRCAVFRLKQLGKEDVYEYIGRVVKGEKLDITEDGKEAIFDLSEGDMRKATNLLQASSTFGKITKDVVFTVAAQAKPKDVREMVGLAVSGNFAEARKKLYDLLVNQGLSGDDVIKAVHREIFSLDMSEEKKLCFIEKLGEYEFRMNQGSNEIIQLEALLAQMGRK